MEPEINEYALTEDERGQIAATVEFHQAEANREIGGILLSITRHRKLAGNWAYDAAAGKLSSNSRAPGGNGAKE